METFKKKLLVQERDAIRAKNDDLHTELRELIKKSEERNEDFTPEDDDRARFISGYMNANQRAIQEIDRKLEIYDVIEDCFDEFYRQIKAEFEIKPKTVTIHGKDLLEEFKRADEVKKHEVKRKKQ